MIEDVVLPPDDRLADVLAVLARRVGVRPSRGDAFEIAASTAPREDWSARLAHGAVSVGLRALEVEGTRDELVSGLGDKRVAVTFVDEGWVVLAPEREVGVPESAKAPLSSARWFLVEADRVVEVARVGAAPFPRLVRLLATERRELVVVAVYAAGAGVLALATPLAIQILINWLAFGALLQPIVVLAALMLIALTAAAALRVMQRHAVEIVQRRIFVRVVSDITARLSRVRLSAFDKEYGPELANRLFDVLTVQKAVATLLIDGLGAALQGAVGLLLLAAYHPLLLGYAVALVAAIAAVVIPLGWRAERTAILESKRKYQVAAWVEEVARHPTAVKLGGGRLARARADELARAYLTDRAAHFRVFLRQLVGFQAVQVSASAGLLLLCAWLVLDGQLTLGQLVAAEFVVTSALAGLGKVVEKLETFYDLLAAMDKLGALVDLPEEERIGLAPAGGTSPARLELRGVRIAPEPGRPGLGATDLDVAAGSVVAVRVGEGAVRARLAEVLAGLRAPSAGVVLRDGRDVAALQPDAAQGEVALLRRDDPMIASVRNNVSLGRARVDDRAVLDALSAVGLERRIGELPAGIDTVLGPHGAPLSDRDVLRLLVARALVGRPRLMVVDGALDGPAGAPLRSVVVGAGTTAVILTADDGVCRDMPTACDTRLEGGA